MPRSDLETMARECRRKIDPVLIASDEVCADVTGFVEDELASFARKYAALRLREAGAGMPDMDTFMARLSCHPKCVTIHDHYQHGFDGSGDQWPQLEGLWGDCSNQWETMIRRMADEEESNE